MRSQEFLQELANKPYNYVQTKRTSQGDEYFFETETGGRYRVRLEKRWSSSDNISQRRQLEELVIGFAYVDPASGKETTDVTGTGHAVRVLSTIAAIVTRYLETGVDPNYISFEGKSQDASRISLYRRIANSAQRWLPNYKKDSEAQSADGFRFTLKRQ